MRVRISDVAREAGVSDATVSYVINNTQKVTPETQRRVRAAIKRLGYKPNVVARSLRVQSTHSVALVVPNVMNHFFGTVAVTLEKTLTENGYALFVCNTLSDVTTEKRLIDALISRRVDGIVLAPCAEDADEIKAIVDFGIPVVLVDRYVEGIDLSTMETNNTDIAKRATEHLIEDGHRRIIAVVEHTLDSTIKLRLEGVKRAAEAGNVEMSVVVLDTEGEERLSQECGAGNAAVFPLNYQAAIRCLAVFRKAGIRFPEDVGFLAFDEGEWMEFFDPPISCIRQPAKEIGTEAAKLLLQQMESDEDQVVMRRIIPSGLIVRASCSPGCKGKWGS